MKYATLVFLALVGNSALASGIECSSTEITSSGFQVIKGQRIELSQDPAKPGYSWVEFVRKKKDETEEYISKKAKVGGLDCVFEVNSPLLTSCVNLQTAVSLVVRQLKVTFVDSDLDSSTGKMVAKGTKTIEKISFDVTPGFDGDSTIKREHIEVDPAICRAI